MHFFATRAPKNVQGIVTHRPMNPSCSKRSWSPRVPKSARARNGSEASKPPSEGAPTLWASASRSVQRI